MFKEKLIKHMVNEFPSVFGGDASFEREWLEKTIDYAINEKRGNWPEEAISFLCGVIPEITADEIGRFAFENTVFTCAWTGSDGQREESVHILHGILSEEEENAVKGSLLEGGLFIPEMAGIKRLECEPEDGYLELASISYSCFPAVDEARARATVPCFEEAGKAGWSGAPGGDAAMGASVWQLVGSEEWSGSAESSGLLLLERRRGLWLYTAADGNNVVYGRGSIRPSDIPAEGYMEACREQKDMAEPEGSAFARAAATGAAERLGTACEYIELLGMDADEFRRLTGCAGHYSAMQDRGSTDPSGGYAVIRNSDGEKVQTFGEPGDAYEAMCRLNREAGTEPEMPCRKPGVPAGTANA